MTETIYISKPLADLLESQRNEIARYKWIESEKSGRDIGWNQAAEEWFQNHFVDWITAQRRTLDEVLRSSLSIEPPLIRPGPLSKRRIPEPAGAVS